MRAELDAAYETLEPPRQPARSHPTSSAHLEACTWSASRATSPWPAAASGACPRTSARSNGCTCARSPGPRVWSRVLLVALEELGTLARLRPSSGWTPAPSRCRHCCLYRTAGYADVPPYNEQPVRLLLGREAARLSRLAGGRAALARPAWIRVRLSWGPAGIDALRRRGGGRWSWSTCSGSRTRSTSPRPVARRSCPWPGRSTRPVCRPARGPAHQPRWPTVRARAASACRRAR